MSESLERYTRQIRLPEVGVSGQERIANAAAEVSGRDGAEIELAYLHRAGLSRVTLLPRAKPRPFPHAAAFRFAGPRSAAAGAWRALRTLRSALESETP
jgi:hypothetical protein